MRRLLFILLLVAGLANRAAADHQTGMGTLGGTVLDAHGKLVAGASVFIQTSDGQHPHVTRTDANGHFQFKRYSAGQYDLRASIHGVFTDWMKRVIIRTGKTTKVTLQLPAAVK